MIDIYRRNKLSLNRTLFALFLLIIHYMLLVQFNVIHVPFFSENPEPVEEPVLLKNKVVPEVIEDTERDVFAYQIKKVEPLYNPIILEAASAHGVDFTMVKAIIMAESGYNRRSVSEHGAGGLMQLMPGTAKSLGVKDIFNPEENIYAGVRYYKSLLKRFKGDVKLALAAYNAGARNVYRYKGVPPFKETRQYINKVLRYQRFYKHGPQSEDAAPI
jgi:soluble lytic murein transglycosylase-like protein